MAIDTQWSKVKTIQLVRDRALTPFADTHDSYADWIPCEACGEWCRPEMHHRRFRSRGGDWRPSNIMALCPVCHHNVTVCSDGCARDYGFSVSQWQHPEDVPVSVWYERRRVLFDNDGGYRLLDNAC